MMAKENQPNTCTSQILIRKNSRDDDSDRPSQSKSIKKKPFTCRVAVFEEQEDPNKRPMYPKHLVYAGGKDLQLEEIRALHYWNKVKGTTGNSSVGQITKTFRDMSTQTDTEPEKIRVLEACTQTEAENSHLALNSEIPAPRTKSSNIQFTHETEDSPSNVQFTREKQEILKLTRSDATFILSRQTEDTETQSPGKCEIGFSDLPILDKPDKIEPTENQFEVEAIVSKFKSNQDHLKSLHSRITTRSSTRSKLGSKTRIAVRPHTKDTAEEELFNPPIVPTPSPGEIKDENLVDDEDDSLTTKAMKLVPTSTPATPFEKTKNKNQTNTRRRKAKKYF